MIQSLQDLFDFNLDISLNSNFFRSFEERFSICLIARRTRIEIT